MCGGWSASMRPLVLCVIVCVRMSLCLNWSQWRKGQHGVNLFHVVAAAAAFVFVLHKPPLLWLPVLKACSCLKKSLRKKPLTNTHVHTSALPSLIQPVSLHLSLSTHLFLCPSLFLPIYLSPSLVNLSTPLLSSLFTHPSFCRIEQRGGGGGLGACKNSNMFTLKGLCNSLFRQNSTCCTEEKKQHMYELRHVYT